MSKVIIFTPSNIIIMHRMTPQKFKSPTSSLSTRHGYKIFIRGIWSWKLKKFFFLDFELFCYRKLGLNPIRIILLNMEILIPILIHTLYMFLKPKNICALNIRCSLVARVIHFSRLLTGDWWLVSRWVISRLKSHVIAFCEMGIKGDWYLDL